jgi:molecular chaperone GrpE
VSTNVNNGQQTPPDAQSEETREEDPPTEEREAPETTAETDEEKDRIEELEAEVEQLQEERDELNDKLLRKAAELDNYRRRMERENERRYESGQVDAVEPILEVLDDFERSIEAAEDLEGAEDPAAAYESLKGGVEMVFRKFRDALETLNVVPIEAEGEPFDEQLHEAMMRQPSDEAEPGTVLHEIRTGYRVDDRVIRHSRVVVAAEPSEDDDN